MLLPDIEVLDRVSSADNLINRLRGSSLTLPTIDTEEKLEEVKNESLAVVERILRSEGIDTRETSDSESKESPKIDDLIPDALDKIKVNLAQATALDVLSDSLQQLRMRMCKVENPKELSKIATDASRIIQNLQPKDDSKNKQQGAVIIYKPAVAELSQYTIVKANE